MATNIPMESKNPQRQGNLEGPLVIIGDSGEELFIVRQGDEDNPEAEAQLYNLRVNKLLDQIKPIGIWLKFMYVPVEGVIPPVPFTPEAVALRVARFQAAKRAREQAAAEAEADEG